MGKFYEVDLTVHFQYSAVVEVPDKEHPGPYVDELIADINKAMSRVELPYLPERIQTSVDKITRRKDV